MFVRLSAAIAAVCLLGSPALGQGAAKPNTAQPAMGRDTRQRQKQAEAHAALGKQQNRRGKNKHGQGVHAVEADKGCRLHHDR